MIKYLSDRAVVRLTGVLTLDSVTALIESMEHAWEDCFHERLEIAISSQGGSIAAYERLLEFIDGLRAEGVRVDTAASGVVGSAAAFLLSMGDKRRASPGCRLRYHLCGVEGEGHLTAADAGDVAAALGDLDDRIVARLAKRSVEATKGSRDRIGVDDFELGDWDAIARIVAVRARTAGSMGKAEALDCLRKTLDRCHADAAGAHGDLSNAVRDGPGDFSRPGPGTIPDRRDRPSPQIPSTQSRRLNRRARVGSPCGRTVGSTGGTSSATRSCWARRDPARPYRGSCRSSAPCCRRTAEWAAHSSSTRSANCSRRSGSSTNRCA